MELPIYKLITSDDETDDSEVHRVSLVERPAIKRNFIAFNEDRPIQFAVTDEDQHIVSGPVLVPDKPIYRKDENGEYFVMLDAETIGKIAYRFFKKGHQKNINLAHSPKDLVPDSVFFESWIVDREKGKTPMTGYEDLPDGTWFMSAKINSDDTWGRIKEGEFKGFSVEGFLKLQPITKVDPEQALMEKIKTIVDQITE